ncbi:MULTISPECIES: mechanosensitive ion channel domain-containing protein [Haloferax]|uniref:Mechanosensitive ion channel n=1 Tax=Haloferax marinum TaxID=2666143 RepID=A0A6A8G3J9_9EURY|nr:MULTISPECIES: mechanosensitive ion channel domain-containing protein [Haloferax]KAB1196142.1 mechanosensitive ion channel [Haloferax sp. CBA1150]MRW95128.1 mechanosensitive ion channel [Haloferax marinum]
MVGSVQPLPLQSIGSIVERIVQTAGVRFLGVLAILALGLVLAYVAGSLVQRLLIRAGVPDAIEGTAFERAARDFDTSTIEILSWLTRYFVLGIALVAALSFVGVNYVDQFWGLVLAILPQLFIAILVLIVGIVVGDKIELLVAERFRGVKLPQVNILPSLAKYTVFFLASLIALSQVGVAIAALIVLLGAYLFGLIVLSAVAFHDLLKSGAAGTYLLFIQPYSIGDEIVVGEIHGVVQEFDMFVTYVESEDREYILPNARVFDEGVGRIR